MEDQYILTLKFSDETEPDIIGISELLYDLNMAYEYSYLKKYGNDNSIAVDELLDTLHFYPVRHRRRRFSKIFGPEHQLKALAIRKESPLLIEVIVPLVGCAWVMLQIIQKVENWPLERRKLQLEVAKLEREERERRERVADDYVSQLDTMKLIEGEIVENLSSNVHQLTDIEVTAYKDRVNKQRQSDA